jgi:hypothetical protein
MNIYIDIPYFYHIIIILSISNINMDILTMRKWYSI